MPEKRIITVIGATGAQGGGLVLGQHGHVRTLLKRRPNDVVELRRGIVGLLDLVLLNLVGHSLPVPLNPNNGEQFKRNVADRVTQDWLPGSLRLGRFRFSHGIPPKSPCDNPHEP